jgi:hypothetical protein
LLKMISFGNAILVGNVQLELMFSELFQFDNQAFKKEALSLTASST